MLNIIILDSSDDEDIEEDINGDIIIINFFNIMIYFIIYYIVSQMYGLAFLDYHVPMPFFLLNDPFPQYDLGDH